MTREENKICKHVKVSLKEYLTALIDELDRRMVQTAGDARLAVEKAEKAQERRLDLLNEFRAQAADESKKYALRDTVETLSAQISRLYGGLIVVGVIGVANLVKLFFH